ncbi:MAG: N-acetylmuramic acid 6-phosphate etherase [Bernardetiaceae bacterium]|nr:N-acetylmuramic acid 6-phosphate etherase [Bernardetiaceae bacterium]
MPITESESLYNDLEKMSVSELLHNINKEDQKVSAAVAACLPAVEAFINQLVPRMRIGGRLFYIGAGTSGRLGILDASECPPTFGVSHDRVIGLIAGGDTAIRKAVEFAEDCLEGAWRDLAAYRPMPEDTVIGIAASGRTPYVLGGVVAAREKGLLTACITCNPDTSLAAAVEYPIEVIVGSEFVTGSTRMKAGTAQKMLLNMISTTAMIQLGKVKGNKMVDMQLNNQKLFERGTRFLIEELHIEKELAMQLLKKYGSVRKVIEATGI